MIRKIIRGFVSLVLMLAVSAALVEAGARVWLFRFASDDQFKRYASLAEYRQRFEKRGQALTSYVPHRYLGYTLSPNYHDFFNRHNSLGYHSEEFPVQKPAGEFRIVCLGSSTTYGLYPTEAEKKEWKELAGKPESVITAALEKRMRGHGMESLEDYTVNGTFPGLLQRYLNKLGFTNVRVINAGVPGYTSFETMLNFELRCLDLDPDIVLVYEGYNDIHARMVWPHKAYAGDNSGSNVHSSGWYALLPPRMRSVAVRILLVSTGRDRSPLNLDTAFGETPKGSVLHSYETEVLQGRFPSKFFQNHPLTEIFKVNPPTYYRRNIENIVAVARAQDVVPILITFTSRPEGADASDPFDVPEYRAALAEHNDVLRDIGKKTGVAVLDLATIFPSDRELFSDQIHFTIAGGQTQAKLIGDYLVSSGLLPPSSASAGSSSVPTVSNSSAR